jgi:hypothetical protein
MPRTARPFGELVEQLRAHVSLLPDYVPRAEEGDRRYLGEIAGKLRLLVLDKGANKASLLRIADRAHVDLRIHLDRPPVRDPAIPADNIVTLRQYLDLLAVALRVTPESDLEQLTNAEFIALWAQQHGAAHEDWSLDERFQASRDFPVVIGDPFGGRSAHDQVLLTAARVVTAPGRRPHRPIDP